MVQVAPVSIRAYVTINSFLPCTITLTRGVAILTLSAIAVGNTSHETEWFELLVGATALAAWTGGGIGRTGNFSHLKSSV